MKIFPSITSFNENLSQLNAWGIDSDELTHLVDKHGVLTDVLNETRDSIELVFRNPDTGDQINLCATIDKSDEVTLIGYQSI